MVPATAPLLQSCRHPAVQPTSQQGQGQLSIWLSKRLNFRQVHTCTRRFVSLTVRIDSETVNDVLSSDHSAKTKNGKKITSFSLKTLPGQCFKVDLSLLPV